MFMLLTITTVLCPNVHENYDEDVKHLQYRRQSQLKPVRHK